MHHSKIVLKYYLCIYFVVYMLINIIVYMRDENA